MVDLFMYVNIYKRILLLTLTRPWCPYTAGNESQALFHKCGTLPVSNTIELYGTNPEQKTIFNCTLLDIQNLKIIDREIINFSNYGYHH